MSKNPHPNATIALGAGAGFSPLVIWALEQWTSIPAPGAAALAGGISALALFIGRDGVRGVIRTIWRGRT